MSKSVFVKSPFVDAVVKPSSGASDIGGSTKLDGDIGIELIIGVDGGPEQKLLDWLGK